MRDGLGYGHDEPIELRVLPITPYISQSVAPDRRAGLTLDDDFGAAHVVVGVYEGARDLRITTADRQRRHLEHHPRPVTHADRRRAGSRDLSPAGSRRGTR